MILCQSWIEFVPYRETNTHKIPHNIPSQDWLFPTSFVSSIIKMGYIQTVQNM